MTLPIAAPLNAIADPMRSTAVLPAYPRMKRPPPMRARAKTAVRCTPSTTMSRAAVTPKTAKHNTGRVVRIPPTAEEKPNSSRNTDSRTPALAGTDRRLSASAMMATRTKIRHCLLCGVAGVTMPSLFTVGTGGTPGSLGS